MSDNSNINRVDRDRIQPYDKLNQHVFFDLEDYLTHLMKKESDVIEMRNYLSQIVLYSDHTNFFGRKLPIIKSCGISIYIPIFDNELNKQYQLLDWYKDSNILQLSEE